MAELIRPRGLAAVKKALRSRYGLWPMLEMRNKLTMGARVPALRRFESAEVTRLATQIGPLAPSLVAVVLPTYRRPELLREAVASALAQTVTDLRLIVVDDGAGLPDSLPADNRLTVVSLSRNTGVLGLVRNVGMRLTRSDYVAFLDDDNTWYPNHLEVALDALDTADTSLVYTAVERRRSDGQILDVLSTPFDLTAFRDSSGYLDANSIVVRREHAVHFSRLPRVRATLPKEDWEFVNRMAGRYAIQHVPTVTVRYLVNEDSFYTQWPKSSAPAVDPGTA